MKQIDFYTKIVGVTFSNDDGTQRQAIIKRLVMTVRGGAAVSLSLRREPYNEHDSNAVAVLAPDGKQIGYLARPVATTIAPLLDKGTHIRVTVEAVTGGRGKNYGMNIRVFGEGGQTARDAGSIQRSTDHRTSHSAVHSRRELNLGSTFMEPWAFVLDALWNEGFYLRGTGLSDDDPFFDFEYLSCSREHYRHDAPWKLLIAIPIPKELGFGLREVFYLYIANSGMERILSIRGTTSSDIVLDGDYPASELGVQQMLRDWRGIMKSPKEHTQARSGYYNTARSGALGPSSELAAFLWELEKATEREKAVRGKLGFAHQASSLIEKRKHGISTHSALSHTPGTTIEDPGCGCILLFATIGLAALGVGGSLLHPWV